MVENTAEKNFAPQVPRWGIQEVAVCGPQEGNPFTEHRVRGCMS